MPETHDSNGIDICKQKEVSVWRSEITKQEYPVEKATKAYALFMLYGKAPKEIAEETGLPVVVVEEWSAKYQWGTRKKEYAEESIKVLDAETRRVQAENRLTTVKTHLEHSREVVRKARDLAIQAATPRGLKNATDAMTAAATMEARAVGLAEKTVERNADENKGKEDKSPMVFIGLGALPPPPEKKAIDVASTEVKEAK